MTQEEKLKEAKRLYEISNADQRYVLESLFPELAESEDERIRKYLKRIIGEWSYDDLYTKGFRKENIIAWLEKQAQKSIWSEEDKNMLEWVIGYLENKMLNTPISEERTACKNAIDWLLEKQSEKKPADKVEPKKIKFMAGDRIIGIVSGMQYYITGVCDNHYNTESGCIIMFCAQENFELYKQKPAAWSEEDARLLDNCISLIEDIPCTEEEQNWLKGIKDRVQPKQEWSEEDKRKIDRIYSILRQASDTHAFSTLCRLIGDKECIELQDFLNFLIPQSKQVLRDTFGYEDGRQFGKNEVLGNPEKYGLQRFAEWSKSDKEIVKEIDTIIHGTNSISDEVRKKLQDWLKSLRPKSQWKPSDEQMEALNAINVTGNISYAGQGQELINLYNDLKRLKD